MEYFLRGGVKAQLFKTFTCIFAENLLYYCDMEICG